MDREAKGCRTHPTRGAPPTQTPSTRTLWGLPTESTMSAALNKDLDEARLELAKAQAQKKRELKRLESGGGSKGVLAALGVGAVQQHAGANFVSVEASAEYAKEKEAQRAARYAAHRAEREAAKEKLRAEEAARKKKEKKGGWFAAKKKKKKKPKPGPRQLLMEKTLRAAYTPTYLRIENTGEVHKDESEFRLLVVSKAFEDLKGTRRKPGGREPESMDWMLRWRKVLDTIEAAFIAHKKDIDVSTLYPVPLTPAEWDGEATVPVEPSQVGELGIGAWGSSSSEDSDSDAEPKVNPRDQWSCLNDPANIWLMSRPESEVLGPQNHGESREATLPQWVKDYGTEKWTREYGPLNKKASAKDYCTAPVTDFTTDNFPGVVDANQWVEDARWDVAGPTSARFQRDKISSAAASANNIRFH